MTREKQIETMKRNLNQAEAQVSTTNHGQIVKDIEEELFAPFYDEDWAE